MKRDQRCHGDGGQPIRLQNSGSSPPDHRGYTVYLPQAVIHEYPVPLSQPSSGGGQTLSLSWSCLNSSYPWCYHRKVSRLFGTQLLTHRVVNRIPVFISRQPVFGYFSDAPRKADL